VVKYSLDIKPSAQKELDALDDTLFARIDRKILALAILLGPQDARN
jgi:mRNA-degrading endonuclease RelE of RelBE toxin-antitoxin system